MRVTTATPPRPESSFDDVTDVVLNGTEYPVAGHSIRYEDRGNWDLVLTSGIPHLTTANITLNFKLSDGTYRFRTAVLTNLAGFYVWNSTDTEYQRMGDGVVTATGTTCSGNDLVLARTEGLASITIQDACVGSGGGAGEVNVQADWTEADTANDAYIQNKPSIFSGNIADLTNSPAAGTLTATQLTNLDAFLVWDFSTNRPRTVTESALAVRLAGDNIQTDVGRLNVPDHLRALQSVVYDDSARTLRVNAVISSGAQSTATSDPLPDWATRAEVPGIIGEIERVVSIGDVLFADGPIPRLNIDYTVVDSSGNQTTEQHGTNLTNWLDPTEVEDFAEVGEPER